MLWAHLTSVGRSWEASSADLALTGDADAARTGNSRSAWPLGGHVALCRDAPGKVVVDIMCGGMDRMLGERLKSGGPAFWVICVERAGILGENGGRGVRTYP